MAIRCPSCGAELDVALFAFGRRVHCQCGEELDRDHPQERRVRTPGGRGARRAAERLRRRADAITWTILYADACTVDVDIAIDRLRDHVRSTMPDREPLFEMVYVARWTRLREQGWSRERSL